jgi:hypothetical protein
MIQKIRSYLLDNEDHKDSIGWYVVIIMLFPVFGMIFQYRKSMVTYLGSVDNKKIERSIFNIKVFEQSKLMENINKMFGEEQGSYFFDMLFQGKTLEQFILSSEIRRVFMQSKFEKLISADLLAGEYILVNLKNKSLDKIKSNVGELPFLLVAGQLKPHLLGSLNVDMNKIDSYCQEVFQVNLLKNIFLAPLSTIEKISLMHYPGLPLKINFIIYSLPVNKINDYKKNINIESISENEMLFFYDVGIKEGRHRKPRNFSFALKSYSLKGEPIKKGKSVAVKKTLEELNKSIKEKWEKIKEQHDKSNDVNLILNSIEEEFVANYVNKNISILFNNNEILECSGDLPKKLKEKILDYVLTQERKDNASGKPQFSVLIEDDVLYFIDDFLVAPVDYYSFEEIKKNIVDSIIVKRAEKMIIDDMEKIRYSLESKDSIVNSLWIKEEKFYSKDMDKDKKDNNDKDFYELVSKKISSGGLREGSSFLEIKDNFHKVYFVSGLTYEVGDKFITRKDQFYSGEVFVESLERHAKIELND